MPTVALKNVIERERARKVVAQTAAATPRYTVVILCVCLHLPTLHRSGMDVTSASFGGWGAGSTAAAPCVRFLQPEILKYLTVLCAADL